MRSKGLLTRRTHKKLTSPLSSSNSTYVTRYECIPTCGMLIDRRHIRFRGQTILPRTSANPTGKRGYARLTEAMYFDRQSMVCLVMHDNISVVDALAYETLTISSGLHNSKRGSHQNECMSMWNAELPHRSCANSISRSSMGAVCPTASPHH